MKSKKIKINCLNCGKEFFAYNKSVGERKFCSRKCCYSFRTGTKSSKVSKKIK